jgi:hypothetical protein
MSKAKLLLFAVLALFAFSAVSAAVASAEDPNSPMLLILEGSSVKALEGTFKGGASSLSALGGTGLTGTEVEGSVKNCKESSVSAKDTNLCEALLTFKGVKSKGTTACRSESSAGKDAIESVLVLTDLHIASEKSTSGELQPLVLFLVLGVAGETELTLNCGGLKDLVKGTIGCLMTPGLTTVAAGGTYTIACKQNATTHDAETGECEQLCEWLTTEPFQSNLGSGFEDAWMNVSATGSLNLSSYIDD